MRARAIAIAIARGPYEPKPGGPRGWFTSMKSVAEVLSDRRRALLKSIRESNPDSAMPARATGRQPGNLSRTLRTMSRYGLVDLQREKNHIRPFVEASEFRMLAAAVHADFRAIDGMRALTQRPIWNSRAKSLQCRRYACHRTLGLRVRGKGPGHRRSLEMAHQEESKGRIWSIAVIAEAVHTRRPARVVSLTIR